MATGNQLDMLMASGNQGGISAICQPRPRLGRYNIRFRQTQTHLASFISLLCSRQILPRMPGGHLQRMSCSFHFIPHPSADSTKRQRELRRSDIRKHAAIVAYKQRVTSAAASVPLPVQQTRGLSQQKALTWLLVGAGGRTKSVVSARKKRRKLLEDESAEDEDKGSPGTISPAERQTYSGFHLLSALDGSFDGAAMYINPFPMRVNPSSSSSLMSSLSPRHSTGAYRALRYCMAGHLPVRMC